MAKICGTEGICGFNFRRAIVTNEGNERCIYHCRDDNVVIGPELSGLKVNVDAEKGHGRHQKGEDDAYCNDGRML